VGVGRTPNDLKSCCDNWAIIYFPRNCLLSPHFLMTIHFSIILLQKLRNAMLNGLLMIRMILSQWNKLKMKNDVFAIKCAKRGNDIYRYRVYTRFKRFRVFSFYTFFLGEGFYFNSLKCVKAAVSYSERFYLFVFYGVSFYNVLASVYDLHFYGNIFGCI